MTQGGQTAHMAATGFKGKIPASEVELYHRPMIWPQKSHHVGSLASWWLLL